MVTSDIRVAKDPGMAPATSLSSGALKVSLAGLLFRLPLNPQEGKKKLKLITSNDFFAFKTADGKRD